MNAKMPELARAFAAAGFRDVRTVLSSGNLVFTAPAAPAAELERKAEAAMAMRLAAAFPTIVRPVEKLRALLATDPYQGSGIGAGAKRVVTFLRGRLRSAPELPIELDGARIVAVRGGEAFSAYVPGPRGPVFMSLIERTFGKDVTTRTWDTVRKVVAAAER
jgi:uncharacterized protein (DUF1697 family)